MSYQANFKAPINLLWDNHQNASFLCDFLKYRGHFRWAFRSDIFLASIRYRGVTGKFRIFEISLVLLEILEGLNNFLGYIGNNG